MSPSSTPFPYQILPTLHALHGKVRRHPTAVGSCTVAGRQRQGSGTGCGPMRCNKLCLSDWVNLWRGREEEKLGKKRGPEWQNRREVKATEHGEQL